VLNQDPRRGPEQEYPLDWINLEAGAVKLELKRQHVTPDSVIPQGQAVLLQRNGNMAIDCTDDVHPDVAYYATLAAKIVGLDIAGMDMILRTSPAHAGPGRHRRGQRRPRPADAPQAHQRRAAPGGHGHRRPPVPARRRRRRPHPVVGIAGTRHNAFIARLVGWLLQLSGKLTGVASSEGMFLPTARRRRPIPPTGPAPTAC
jgi:cyanophycin synthetase